MTQASWEVSGMTERMSTGVWWSTSAGKFLTNWSGRQRGIRLSVSACQNVGSWLRPQPNSCPKNLLIPLTHFHRALSIGNQLRLGVSQGPRRPDCLLSVSVYVPVTFALDLPTNGAAAAQRKQLLPLLLWEENQAAVNQKPSPEHSTVLRWLTLTLLLDLVVKKMFGRRVSGPREQ